MSWIAAHAETAALHQRTRPRPCKRRHAAEGCSASRLREAPPIKGPLRGSAISNSSVSNRSAGCTHAADERSVRPVLEICRNAALAMFAILEVNPPGHLAVPERSLAPPSSALDPGETRPSAAATPAPPAIARSRLPSHTPRQRHRDRGRDRLRARCRPRCPRCSCVGTRSTPQIEGQVSCHGAPRATRLVARGRWRDEPEQDAAFARLAPGKAATAKPQPAPAP